jgi:hypothetical protein
MQKFQINFKKKNHGLTSNRQLHKETRLSVGEQLLTAIVVLMNKVNYLKTK